MSKTPTQQKKPSRRELERRLEATQRESMSLASKFKPSIDVIEAMLLVETSIEVNKEPVDWGQEELDVFNQKLDLASKLTLAIQNAIEETMALPEHAIDGSVVWYALALQFGKYHTTMIKEIAEDEESATPRYNFEYLQFIKSSVAHIKLSPHEFFLQESIKGNWTLEEFKAIMAQP